MNYDEAKLQFGKEDYIATKDINYPDRFRFRAWDNENKKMYYDCERFYPEDNDLNNSFVDFLTETYYNGSEETPSKYDVMQCTGLRDNHFQLVFENDIVEWDNGIKSGLEIVTYDEHDLCFKLGEDCPFNKTLEENHIKTKVLGNIYESRALYGLIKLAKNGTKK